MLDKKLLSSISKEIDTVSKAATENSERVAWFKTMSQDDIDKIILDILKELKLVNSVDKDWVLRTIDTSIVQGIIVAKKENPILPIGNLRYFTNSGLIRLTFNKGEDHELGYITKDWFKSI